MDRSVGSANGAYVSAVRSCSTPKKQEAGSFWRSWESFKLGARVPPATGFGPDSSGSHQLFLQLCILVGCLCPSGASSRPGPTPSAALSPGIG